MKLIRLAVIGAAAYGIKKWLDENPSTKQQVREAADTAKVQAKHAAETVKQQVDERRQKPSTTTGEETLVTTPTGATTSTTTNGFGEPYQPAP